MVKSWQDVVVSDFKIDNPSWAPSRPFALVLVNRREVTLSLSERISVDETHIDLFRSLIEDWVTHLEAIASKTKKFLGARVDSKKLSGKQLLLWSIDLYLDEDAGNQPTAGMYYFKIDSTFSTNEVDEDSTIELSISIDDGQTNWAELDFDIINDF